MSLGLESRGRTPRRPSREGVEHETAADRAERRPSARSRATGRDAAPRAAITSASTTFGQREERRIEERDEARGPVRQGRRGRRAPRSARRIRSSRMYDQMMLGPRTCLPDRTASDYSRRRGAPSAARRRRRARGVADRRRRGRRPLRTRRSDPQSLRRARASRGRARVIDSLTPGWRQIGAVWLPLPHLINSAARRERLGLPHGDSGRRRIGRSPGDAASRRSRGGSRARPGRWRPRCWPAHHPRQSQRALPAEHADDRAAAARPVRASRCWRWTSGSVAGAAAPAWAGPALAALLLTRYEGWCVGAALFAVAAFAAPPRRCGAPVAGWRAGRPRGVGRLLRAQPGEHRAAARDVGLLRPRQPRAAPANRAPVRTCGHRVTSARSGPLVIAGLAGGIVCLWRARDRRPRCCARLALLAAGVPAARRVLRRPSAARALHGAARRGGRRARGDGPAAMPRGPRARRIALAVLLVACRPAAAVRTPRRRW